MREGLRHAHVCALEDDGHELATLLPAGSSQPVTSLQNLGQHALGVIGPLAVEDLLEDAVLGHADNGRVGVGTDL